MIYFEVSRLILNVWLMKIVVIRYSCCSGTSAIMYRVPFYYSTYAKCKVTPL